MTNSFDSRRFIILNVRFRNFIMSLTMQVYYQFNLNETEQDAELSVIKN